jgi:hypothetical protein
MDKVEGLRPHSQFGYSISTDGVSASVQFIKYVEKVPVEEEYRAKLQKKVYYEKYILESAELKQQLKKKNRKFRSVDPGIINPMTVYDVIKTGKFMETDN